MVVLVTCLRCGRHSILQFLHGFRRIAIRVYLGVVLMNPGCCAKQGVGHCRRWPKPSGYSFENCGSIRRQRWTLPRYLGNAACRTCRRKFRRLRSFWATCTTAGTATLRCPPAAVRVAPRHARLIGFETSFRRNVERQGVPPHGAVQSRLRGQALQFAQCAGQGTQRQPALPFKIDNVRAHRITPPAAVAGVRCAAARAAAARQQAPRPRPPPPRATPPPRACVRMTDAGRKRPSPHARARPPAAGT